MNKQLTKDWVLLSGDCLEHLKFMGENTVDALVTDPPGGISFMGKDWDKSEGFIPTMTEIFKECLRVMKPGAHGLVWAIPRTSHWTATALEDAGFEIRDVVTHLFGSGFPKSLDVSKAIDKAAGAEREVVGKYQPPNGKPWNLENDSNEERDTFSEEKRKRSERMDISAPSTPEAKRWQGFGTALKPASEHWILIRKPLSEKTVAANVLKWGCGGLNIDASRIPGPITQVRHADFKATRKDNIGFGFHGDCIRQSTFSRAEGRFPANLLFSHNPDCVEVGVKKVKGITGGTKPHQNEAPITQHGGFKETENRPYFNHASEDGTETVSAFECTPGCAVAMLDAQSGTLHGSGNKLDTGTGKDNAYTASSYEIAYAGRANRDYGSKGGGASRFFYVAKASKRDKNAGLEDSKETRRSSDARPNSGDFTGKFPDHDHREKTGNFHPTVKSTTLMAYLIRLVTSPGGLVLDPFLGSGSTGVAALREGFRFIGIEKEKEYIAIAQKRMENT